MRSWLGSTASMRSLRTTSRDRPSFGQYRYRPILPIVQQCLWVDAQGVVDRRGHVAGSVGIARGPCPIPVGAANDLAAPNTTTGEEDRAGGAPVVAAAIAV